MQTIILLHGAIGFGEDLQTLGAILKQAEFNVHTITFSGHGTKPFSSEFGITQFSKELKNYISENSLKKPIVFGYSMGGYVALNLAVTDPEILGKTICLGTKFDWNKEFVSKETSMLNSEFLTEKNPDFAKSLETKHGSQWKELLVKTADMMRDLSEAKLLRPEDLSSLKVPVLLGIGDKDKMVSVNETLKVFQSIPNAAMYMLPKSKHQLESINTLLLSKIIFDFIQVAD